MKNTRKALAILLVLVTMLVSMSALVTQAADGDFTVYLSPNSNWKADNARFAIYVWNDNNSNKWVDMTDNDGDKIYEAVVPSGYNKIIFCRMDPINTSNNWDNKWNQTEDLTLPTNGDNLYKVASGTWDKGGGNWSRFDSTACVHEALNEGTVTAPASCNNEGTIEHTCAKCGESYTESLAKLGHSYGSDSKCKECGNEAVYIIAGNVMKADGEYRDGDNSTLFVSSWDTTDENNRMHYDENAGCFVKTYKNVAKGEYHFKVTEDWTWDISYGQDGGNCYVKVEENGSTVTITFKEGNVSVAALKPSPAPSYPNNDNTTDDTEAGDSSDNEPEQLGFFEMIFKAIGDFFIGIGNFFKNLFS